MSGAPLFNLTGVRPRLYESVLKMNGTGSTRPSGPATQGNTHAPRTNRMEISNGSKPRRAAGATACGNVHRHRSLARYLPGPGALQPCNPDVTPSGPPEGEQIMTKTPADQDLLTLSSRNFDRNLPSGRPRRPRHYTARTSRDPGGVPITACGVSP